MVDSSPFQLHKKKEEKNHGSTGCCERSELVVLVGHVDVHVRVRPVVY